MKFLVIKLLTVLVYLSCLPEISAQQTIQTGSRTIYLIRHGDYNSEDKRDPDVGKELIPLGIAQTRLLSTRLRSMGINFNSITSSTMTRARQTAMIINEEFPLLSLQQSRLIRECTPPTWREDITADESETDLNECVENLEKAFNEYFIPSQDEKDRHDIIVCHGNVIRYFVTKVLNVNTMAWLQMTIGNCSLTIVKIRPNGSMKLVSFNDVGHIPPNMQTSTGGDNKSKSLILPAEQ
jgi:serine/threonine-protein phosphatase PGAM5